MDPVTRLALAARDGDERALEGLVRALHPDVHRLCSRMVSPSAAADLTQDTFVRAWRSLRSFRGDSSARVWVLGVARHVIADHLRRNARRQRIRPTVSTDPDTLHRYSASGDVTEVHAARSLLDELDDDRREAFVLTQLLGLSYEEAAEACDVPVGTIRSRVARAREQLVRASVRAEAAGS